MGTWVAYELLAAALAAGLPAPRGAFLSAMPAPDLPPAERPWRPQRSLSEADFKARRLYQHRTALIRSASPAFMIGSFVASAGPCRVQLPCFSVRAGLAAYRAAPRARAAQPAQS